MIMETYTVDAEVLPIPDFITVEAEVTDQPLYSMYNLSMKDYHPPELKAGANRSAKNLDYRHIYAREASRPDEDCTVENGFHW